MNARWSAMKNGRKAITILVSWAFVLALHMTIMLPASGAQIFSQDLTMHSTTTTSGTHAKGAAFQNPAIVAAEYYSKNAIKTSSAGNDSIIRFDVEKIISIDNKNKTYREMTFKQAQELLSKASTDLGNISREEMELFRKMMGPVATAFTIEKAGRGESIAGYATDKYLLKGPMDAEIWAASGLKLPAVYYDAMKMQAPNTPLYDLKVLYEEMKKIGEIPLKSIISIKMMGVEMKITKIVTSIEKGPIPASIFEIPAGYKLEAPK
jgi:hypothetical protein